MGIVQFIIYVANQEKSTDFYRNIFNIEPSLNVPGMTEFEFNESCKLGIMPESGIRKILGETTLNPASGNGIPRCEIYLLVDNPDSYFFRAISAGAKSISSPVDRDWGHRVGYVQDCDGHIIAFACLT